MPRSVRRALLHSAICLSAYLTAACYESPFPLDPMPQADIDAGVPGAWHCVSSDPGDRDMTLTIARMRDRVYAVTFQEFNHESDRYEAHASVVAGTTLVNLRSVKPSAKPWIFVRYALLQPKVLQLQIVDDNALKQVAASPAAVRQAIARQLKDAALFTDACTCVRMDEK